MKLGNDNPRKPPLIMPLVEENGVITAPAEKHLLIVTPEVIDPTKPPTISPSTGPTA
jgi:hypothetical protein